jgi:hypothetical protein
MADFGNPGGFDIATVLVGSGLTLLLSAGIFRYGNRFQYTTGELYAIGGGALATVGVLLGLLLVAKGLR